MFTRERKMESVGLAFKRIAVMGQMGAEWHVVSTDLHGAVSPFWEW